MRSFSPLLSVSLLLACGEPGTAGRPSVDGTPDGPDVILDAVTEDVFTVGSVAGDSWDTFGTVNSVYFDDQANLHIFDAQAQHIAVVGPGGALIRTVGGRGQGPGEFDGVTGAIVRRDGSYIVMGLSYVDLLGADGEFVRRVTTDAMFLAERVLPDGRPVTHQLVRLDSGPPREGGNAIHVLSLDGTGPELFYTAWQQPGTGRGQFSMGGSPSSGLLVRSSAGRAFAPVLDYEVLSDGRLALIDSIGYRVKIIGPGGSVANTIERPIAPLPVDDALRDAARERYEQQTAGPVVASTDVPIPFQIEREGVEALTFADEVPVLYGLKVDWEDRIWLQRRGPTGHDDGPTDLVTPDGHYIGTLPPDGLRTPSAFGPDGLMAYIEHDELDVPTVRVVRLLALEPLGGSAPRYPGASTSR